MSAIQVDSVNGNYDQIPDIEKPTTQVLAYKQTLPPDYGSGTFYRKRLRDPLDPLYEEINGSIALSLPQHDDPEGQRNRRQELDERKTQYPWCHDLWGTRGAVPPFPSTIPKEDFEGIWHAVEGLGLTANTVVAFSAAKAVDSFASMFRNDDPWASINHLYDFTELPTVASRWREDWEFARQRLAGLNPKTLRRCTGIPDHFCVTDEMLAPFLPVVAGRRLTIAQLIKNGKLYIIDFTDIYKNIRNPPERKLQRTCGLFLQDDTQPEPWQQFRAIAIQIVPWDDKTQPKPPVFLPNDGPLWLVAKSHFQVSDCCFHGVVTHLLCTHLTMESTWTSFRRTLSNRHPLMELLFPHFYVTLAINYAGRRFLIADSPTNLLPRTLAMGFDGQNDILLKYYGNQFKFTHLEAPEYFEMMGTADTKALPNYPYRDDVLLYWNLIMTHTKNCLKIIYPKDSDIREDYELTALAHELLSPEGSDFGSKGLRNTNGVFSRSDLEHLICTIIYVVTAEHNAINMPQYDMLGYVPNMPCAFFMDPPMSKDVKVTEQDIADAMPDFTGCLKQALMFRGLGTTSQYPIGQFAPAYFQGMPEMRGPITAFREEIRKLAAVIDERNKDTTRRKVPYLYLHPLYVANSIQM